MAQRILGLDLGAKSVKGVLIESAYRGFSVLDAATVPLPPAGGEVAPFERHLQALRELLSEEALRAETIAGAYPGIGASSHTIVLPFVDLRRIEQTIPFEVEGQIPFDLEEVAWDWQPIGQQDGKTHLYVSVARKQELAELLAAFRDGRPGRRMGRRA